MLAAFREGPNMREDPMTADTLTEQVRQHLATANRERPVKSPPADVRESRRQVASLAMERVRATTRLSGRCWYCGGPTHPDSEFGCGWSS